MRYITLLLAAGASGRLYVGSGFEHKNIADKTKETSAYRTFCTPLWPMNPPLFSFVVFPLEKIADKD